MADRPKVHVKDRVSGAILFTTLCRITPQGNPLGSAYMGGQKLAGRQLANADMSGAMIYNADFSEANLENATLWHATVGDGGRSPTWEDRDSWILCGARFDRAKLRGANLEQAFLKGSSLAGADLRRANLRDADLRFCNLNGADLRGANLAGTNFQKANLTDARFSSIVKCNLRTVWPDERNDIAFGTYALVGGAALIGLLFVTALLNLMA